MAGQPVKVEAELNFDSNAAKLFGEVKEELASIHTDVSGLKDGVKDFFTQVAAYSTANLLGPALHTLKEMSTEAIELASHAYDTQQGIAGMMDAMGPREWEISRGAAEMLHEEIRELAITSGTASSGLEEAHRAIRGIIGGAVGMQVASDNLDSIATLAGVTRMNVQQVGEQFGKMALGAIQMDSPLFALVKQTGIFHSNSAKIQEEWAKLSQTDRIARLEQAFGSIADNLGDAPLTLSDMLTSIQESGEAFLESFGGAVLRELLDNVDGLREAIAGGGEEFADFAESLGKDVGENLADIVDSLTEAIDYMREHGTEIKQDIVDAFRFAKDVFDFILSHKTELALALGAGALMKNDAARGVIGSFASGAFGAGRAAMTGEALFPMQDPSMAAKMGSGAVNVLTKGVPALFGAVAAGGPPVWAATAAVAALTAGVGYLAHEAHEADEERRREIDSIIEKERERSESLETLSDREFRMQVEERERLIELAEELGEKTEHLNRLMEAGGDREALREQYVIPAQVAAGNLALMQKQGAAPELIRSQEELAVSEMTNSLREAVKTGDTEVAKALLGILLDNEKLKAAFMNTADTVQMGAEGLKMSLKALEEMGLEGGYLSKFFQKEFDREFDAKAQQTQVNFNGGQTFKIQQEFRDQDPDRIAVAFEKRITRSAVARVQASTSSPFGA